MRWTVAVIVLVALFVGYTWIDRFDPDSLKGKRVVVTGASTGIGEQIAYHYARFGAKLLITARRESRLQEVVEKCREVGDRDGEYYYLPADMGDIHTPKKLIDKAVEKFGGVDYLVLNHISLTPMAFWTGSEKNLTRLQQIYDVNYRSYVHTASYALPHLTTSNGSLVVVSSVAGKIAQPYQAVYSSIKFGLDGFFSSLRLELAIRKVDVSVTLCILGFIGTDNAITEMKNFGLNFLISVISPADPADTAMAVIKGGATRTKEIYYPYMEARSSVFFKQFVPDVLEMVLQYLYKKD